MKVLGLDYGHARTGVAVSDPTGTIARPLPVIAQIDTPDGQATLRRVLESESPECIVVGEPLLMSGTSGAQARAVRGFVGRLRSNVETPVALVDERLSTAEALKRRQEGAIGETDSVAACVLVEAYLARSR